MMKRIIFFFVVILVGKLNSQTFLNSPQPWREEYNISLEGFQFSHPMTVLNKSDVEKIKNRIANNIEPQKTAFMKLLEESALQLSFIPDAPSTMDIMGGYEPNSNLEEMREWLWRNCHAAYTCALAYAFTGETVYADKAKQVLMNWANTGTTFTGADRGLQLGSWFSPMLHAADLIYNYPGWSESERYIFKAWWRNNCINGGDVLNVMRRKDNNWKDAGILGILAAAVVLEDTSYLKEALIQLKSYFFTRTDGYVELPGPGWKIKKDNNGVYLPREVVRNEGSSGLTYTAYALTTMVQCFEIARYSGFNLWNYSTEEGAAIRDVINQYFAWDIEKKSFPWNSNPNRTDKRRNCYELGNTFLDVKPELETWVKNNWPVINGREGDEYCTLNKGDLEGSGIIPPAAPSTLTANAVSNKQINIKWKDNSNNEDGFLVERKTTSSSYFTLAKVASDVNTFSDKFFLTDSTTYTYRVKAYKDLANSIYSNEVTETTLPKECFLMITNPSDDSYVVGGKNSDNNYGGSIDLFIYKSTNVDSLMKSFLKFDLSKKQLGEIRNAKVRLFAISQFSSEVILFASSDNWNENTITWNNAPALGDTLVNSLLSSSQEYCDWDITSYVQQEFNKDSSVSLVVYCRDSITELIKFYSKENGEDITELLVVYKDSSAISNVARDFTIIPNDLILEQNYPNPFNSSTKIRYFLPNSGIVTLRIYDMLGKEVSVAVSEYQREGFHEFEWNSSIASRLSSGFYYARLVTMENSKSIKMLLIK